MILYPRWGHWGASEHYYVMNGIIIQHICCFIEMTVADPFLFLDTPHQLSLSVRRTPSELSVSESSEVMEDDSLLVGSDPRLVSPTRQAHSSSEPSAFSIYHRWYIGLRSEFMRILWLKSCHCYTPLIGIYNPRYVVYKPYVLLLLLLLLCALRDGVCRFVVRILY